MCPSSNDFMFRWYVQSGWRKNVLIEKHINVSLLLVLSTFVNIVAIGGYFKTVIEILEFTLCMEKNIVI